MVITFLFSSFESSAIRFPSLSYAVAFTLLKVKSSLLILKSSPNSPKKAPAITPIEIIIKASNAITQTFITFFAFV